MREPLLYYIWRWFKWALGKKTYTGKCGFVDIGDVKSVEIRDWTLKLEKPVRW